MDIISIIKLLVYLFVVGFCLKLVFDYVVKRRESRDMGIEMERILANGSPNVKKRNLNFLWLTEDGNKKINAGKIVSYVRLKVKDTEFNCFVVRKKRFEQLRFYLIDDDSLKEKDVAGDVVSMNWNYKLDDNSNFYIVNKSANIIIKALEKGEQISVDTLSKLAPLVNSSINANPIHRIRLRESRMIR